MGRGQTKESHKKGERLESSRRKEKVQIMCTHAVHLHTTYNHPESQGRCGYQVEVTKPNGKYLFSSLLSHFSPANVFMLLLLLLLQLVSIFIFVSIYKSYHNDKWDDSNIIMSLLFSHCCEYLPGRNKNLLFYQVFFFGSGRRPCCLLTRK